MKIRADIQISQLDEVMVARAAVRQKSAELEEALTNLYCVLNEMGLVISQPTDVPVD